MYIRPPKEAGTKHLWKLKKSVYGLCDASRIWYLKIRDELIATGAVMSKFDSALFYWKHNEALHGIVATHVDDFLYCGTELFHNKVIDVIKSKFQISKESEDSFRHLGLEIVQKDTDILLHQDNYIQEIQPLTLNHSEINERVLNEGEVKELQRIIGQLIWTVTQTRPDIAFDTCQEGANVQNAKVGDVKRVNKAIKKLKSESVSLSFPSLGDMKKVKIVAFSDASFNNLPKGGSQGGFICFLVGENGRHAPLCWSSKRIRRVTKSTIGAETLALVEAAENCFLIRSTLNELFDIKSNITIITDNLSLKDPFYSTNCIEDKRLTVDICILRDMLYNQDISEIKWVASSCQIADSLTKCGASTKKLLEALDGSTILV